MEISASPSYNQGGTSERIQRISGEVYLLPRRLGEAELQQALEQRGERADQGLDLSQSIQKIFPAFRVSEFSTVRIWNALTASISYLALDESETSFSFIEQKTDP